MKVRRKRQKVIFSILSVSKNGLVHFWVDELSFSDLEDLGTFHTYSGKVGLDHVKSVSLIRHINFPGLKITAAESDE
jgi:hypothetical protein